MMNARIPHLLWGVLLALGLAACGESGTSAAPPTPAPTPPAAEQAAPKAEEAKPAAKEVKHACKSCGKSAAVAAGATPPT